MVRTERAGAALLVTIDRPERRNAIDGTAAAALRAAFDAFVADGDAAVLVLTGAGEEAFCAGADLKALDTLAARVPAVAAETVAGGPSPCEAAPLCGGPLGFTHLHSPKPVIAAVSGWCVAGGLELALWCDLRIATATARFGCTERRFGVPLVDGGTQRLPRLVGLGRALDLILTGRVIDASEALAIGLITEVVAPGAHVERALALAEALAALPRDTLLCDREAVYRGLDGPLAEGLALEASLGAARLPTAAEGAARFAAGEGRGGSDLDRRAGGASGGDG